MRILLTNDDGILAPGLNALLTFVQSSLSDILYPDTHEKIEITVIAPLEEQSGKSHGIELKKDIPVRRMTLPHFPAVTAFGVGSTPADCVRFGVCGLEETYDLVLSGINCGYNIGGDIVYSGTVGAVLEASSTGIPAIALSMDFSAFDTPDSRVNAVLDTTFRYIVSQNLLSRHSLYNINLPLSPHGIRLTRQGSPYYLDHFRLVSQQAEQAEYAQQDISNGQSDNYRQIGYCAHVNRHSPELDTDSVMDGYISIMPLTLNRTDLVALETLRKSISGQ